MRSLQYIRNVTGHILQGQIHRVHARSKWRGCHRIHTQTIAKDSIALIRSRNRHANKITAVGIDADDGVDFGLSLERQLAEIGDVIANDSTIAGSRQREGHGSQPRSIRIVGECQRRPQFSRCRRREGLGVDDAHGGTDEVQPPERRRISRISPSQTCGQQSTRQSESEDIIAGTERISVARAYAVDEHFNGQTG